MTGREAAKVRKAVRLLREARAALDGYFAEPTYGPSKSIWIARVADQTAGGIGILEAQLSEAGR